MTIDPREEKLPKWAKEALDHARMQALVRFPSEPKPVPHITESVGHANAPRGFWIYSQTLAGVFAHWVGKNGYMYRSEKEEEDFGSQIRGEYYLTKEAAILAHRWAVAENCARDMLKAMNPAIREG